MLSAGRVWIVLKRAFTLAVLLAAGLVLAGLTYEQVSRRSARASFPPPGRMLSVDGFDMHSRCMGEGTPVVILESGLTGLGSMQWYAVQPSVAQFTTVCAYDRAGILWSERRNGPRTGARIVEELHALLNAAGIPPPYVLVGHSAGGIFTRLYDNRFPDEAAGFVFIDSSHPEQSDRLPGTEGAPPPDWALTAFGAIGLIRLMSSGVPEHAPPSVQEAVQARSPNSVRGLYAETASIEETFREARELDWAPGALGSRPVIVLTRGRFEDMSGDPERTRAQWIGMQTELAALSDNSDRRSITGTGHFIHLDDPAAVVEAIRDVVTAARNHTRLR